MTDFSDFGIAERIAGDGDWKGDSDKSFLDPQLKKGGTNTYPNDLILNKSPGNSFRSRHVIDPLSEQEMEVSLTELGAKLTTAETLQRLFQAILCATGHQGRVHITGGSYSGSVTLVIPNTAVDTLKQVLTSQLACLLNEVGVSCIKIGKYTHRTTKLKYITRDCEKQRPFCGSFHEELNINLVQTLMILMKQKQSVGMEQDISTKEIGKARLEELTKQIQVFEEKLTAKVEERKRLAGSLKTAEDLVKQLKEKNEKLQQKNNKRWEQIRSTTEINRELDEKNEELEEKLSELSKKLESELKEKEMLKAELENKQMRNTHRSSNMCGVEAKFENLQIGDKKQIGQLVRKQKKAKAPMMNRGFDVSGLPDDDLQVDGVPYDVETSAQMEQMPLGVQPHAEEVEIPKKDAKRPLENTQPANSVEAVVAATRLGQDAGTSRETGALKTRTNAQHPTVQSGYSASIQPQGGATEGCSEVKGDSNASKEKGALEETDYPGKKPDIESPINEPGSAIACSEGSERGQIVAQRVEHMNEEMNKKFTESNKEDKNSSLKQRRSPQKKDPLKTATDCVTEKLSVRDWKPLARKLGLSDNEIENIEYENRHESARENVHKTLVKWRLQNADASAEGLIKGLQSMQQNWLAEEVRKKIAMENRSEAGSTESKEGSSGLTFELPRKPEALFTDELLDDLQKEDLNQSEILDVVKKLRLTGDKQMELHQTGNPRNMASVCKVWESMTKPMQQTEDTQCKLIRQFVRVMRDVKRTDIVDILKNHIPRGTGKIGTQLPERQSIQEIPFSIRTRLVNQLSVPSPDGRDWRKLAEDIQIPNVNIYIKLWETRPTPAEQVLHTWQSRANATVGNLYDILVSNKMNDSAALLE